MKQYKGWEIAKMICDGTLKEGSQLIGEYGQKFKILSHTLVSNEVFGIRTVGEEVQASFLTDRTALYTIVQQPVSFMEAIKGKIIKLEHELVANGSIKGNLEFIIVYLGQTQESEKLKKIVKEGKWYIEESED